MYPLTMSLVTLIASAITWGLIGVSSSKLNIHETNIPKMSALHKKALEIFKATRDHSLKTVQIISEDSVAFEFPLSVLTTLTLNQPVSIILTREVTDRVDLSIIRVTFRHNHVVNAVSSLVPFIKDNEKIVILVKVSSAITETMIESWLDTTFSILWAAFICNVAVIVEIEAPNTLSRKKLKTAVNVETLENKILDNDYKSFTEIAEKLDDPWKVDRNSNGSIEVPREDCTSKNTKEHNSTTIVYIYQPYAKKTLEKVPKRRLKKLFDTKVKDMAGHELRIGGHLIDPNFYQDEKEDNSPSRSVSALVDVLAHKLNATIKQLYTQNRDTITRNGTLNALYRHLINGDLDLTVTATFMYPELSGIFSTTYPRKRIDLLFVLPRYLYTEVTYKNVLGGNVRILLLIMAITLIMTLTIILTTKKILRLQIEVDLLINLMKTIFNQSTKLSYTAKSTTLRVALGSWILYTSLFSLTLQTLVTSRIIKPYGRQSFDTLEDLRESDIRIVIRDDHFEYVMTHAEEEVRNIVSKKSLKTSNRTIFATPNPHLGYMLSDELAHYAKAMSYHRLSSRPLFKILGEAMLPNFEAYYLRKGSPFLQEFDKLLSSLTEFGILNYWNENNDYEMLLEVIIPDDSQATCMKCVKMENLMSVFYFYTMGLSVALILFFYEVAFGTISASTPGKCFFFLR